MDEEITYAQLISCTPLTEFRETKQMELEWELATNGQYTLIEIYRYIGEHMGCTNPDLITDGSEGVKLVYSIESNNDGTITENRFFPVYTSSTIEKSIGDISEFIDDFGVLASSKYDIDMFQNLVANTNNDDVLNDISSGRRVIYYILKSYTTGSGGSGDIPYLVTPSYSTKTFINHSTKTQVRHDYLHYEGDEIWNAYVASAGMNPGISRTAVDVNRVYSDTIHAGPTGRGGSAWVSDRSTSQVYQYDLKDGALRNKYQLPVSPSRGHGIGVHTETGNCIAGGGSRPVLFYCDVSYQSPLKIIGPLTDKTYCYGVIPLYGYSDRLFIADRAGEGGILVLKENLTESILINTGDIDGYAAAACPNGLAVQASRSTAGVYFVNPETANTVFKPWGSTGASRIGVDNYNMYPNTIINAEGNRNCFSIRNYNEYNVTVPFALEDENDVDINWRIKYNIGQDIKAAPGYDGENNMWDVRSKVKDKYYRTAGDWYANDGRDERFIYPYGGYSRYPSTTLDRWQSSYVNTREIEWFLTRNHGVSSYVEPYRSVLKEIDPPTLDDTVSVNWDPERPLLSETAYESWWNMVDQKMVRVWHAQSGSTQWRRAPYFAVYKDGFVDKKSRKWGIRINVEDIRTSLGNPGSNLDDFYENHRDQWVNIIIKRLRAWSNAFASQTTSYIGNTNRNNIINGNQLGVLVHPFYRFAKSLNTSGKYVNPGLPTKTQNNINHYFGNIKYFEFGSLQMTTLYLYSDFTGNMLAGASDTQQSTRSIIHPENSIDSILFNLGVSGRQYNTGYQDTPAYCYPWTNTASSASNSISGYDDFTVQFAISSSSFFLLTTYSLSTDDFASPYLGDTNNIPVLTINPSGIITNVEYTYQSPSVNGVYYIPSGSAEFVQYISSKPNGSFHPIVGANVRDLYDYNLDTNSCNMRTITAGANVSVFERWPEARFYVKAEDDKYLRQYFFCNNSWGRACPETTVINELVISGCPAGYDGSTTWVRSVTVVDGYIDLYDDWILQEGYCFINIDTELSAVSASCDYLYEGTAVYQRTVKESYYTGATSYTDWNLLTSNCYAPTVTYEYSCVSGVQSSPSCQYMYEAIYTYYNATSTTVYDHITATSGWVLSAIDCYAPTITILTALSTCPAGYVGSSTFSNNVSVTYFNEISTYGSWYRSSSAECVEDAPITPYDYIIASIDEAQDQAYTNSAGNPKPHWSNDIIYWYANMGSFNIARFIVFNIDNMGYPGDGYVWPVNNTEISPYDVPPIPLSNIIKTNRPTSTTKQTTYAHTVTSTMESIYGASVWSDMASTGGKLVSFVDDSGSMSINTVAGAMTLLKNFCDGKGIEFIKLKCNNERWIKWFADAALDVVNCQVY
jgi:hypothetical protein